MTDVEVRPVAHTPGPWKAAVYSRGDRGLIITSQSSGGGAWDEIACIFNNDKDDPDLLTRRNASLIASAPDLLDIVKESFELIRDDSTSNPLWLRMVRAIRMAESGEVVTRHKLPKPLETSGDEA